jgi:uncharacterized protein (DUF934 family)
MNALPAAHLLTSDGDWVADRWHLLRETEGFDHGTPTLLPLSAFLHEDVSELLGVWLAPNDDARALGERIARVPVIAIDFPKVADGRGYSHATLLRTRLGYTGELRAVGEILIDQLFMLRRVGFTSFALRPDQSIAAARAALRRYSNAYQAAADSAVAAFRRRTALAS